MRLVIDRFEGKYAICEGEEQRYFAIELQELPEDVSPGSVLEITEEGELVLNEEETQRRRQRILEKQRSAFEG